MRVIVSPWYVVQEESTLDGPDLTVRASVFESLAIKGNPWAYSLSIHFRDVLEGRAPTRAAARRLALAQARVLLQQADDRVLELARGVGT